MKKRFTALSIVAVSAVVLAACGGDDSSTESPSSEAPAVDATGDVSEAVIDVFDVWARTSPAMTSLGAVYMSIESSVDDELLSASVDATIAGSVEVHETTTGAMPSDSMPMDGMDGMDGMAGEMTMREVDAVPIPAGETVMLIPGGYHIMLLDLVNPLELGQTVEVTLTFANAGSITVVAEVRDEAP